MPKKKNAYWTFMLAYKREHKIESQQVAMQQADAVWRSMSDTERKKYTKEETVTPSNAPMTEIEIQHKEEAIFQQTMLDEISSELAMAKKYNNLSTYNFFIIHINSFCYQTEVNKYFPCEIGISSFNLKDGVNSKNVYHGMIFPGALPNGYSSSAKLISERSHQIPWEYDEIDNTSQIFKEMLEFLLQRSSKLPILYTKKTDMELVRNVLDRWCEDYNPRINFTVYNVQTLFSLLLKNVATNEPWSSESLSFIELQKDLHSFAPGISCEYHDSADVQIYCARSIVIRTSYIICQNCCKALQIILIPGQHIPANIESQNEEGRSNSSREINNQIQNASTSSVRVDTSDEDTISSFERSSMYEEDTASSIIFPVHDNSSVSSDRTVISDNYRRHMSGAGNLSNDLSSRTGSSGFSRRPAVLPSTVNENFEELALGQENRQRRPGGMARGRGGAIPKGKGRGHPFRK